MSWGGSELVSIRNELLNVFHNNSYLAGNKLVPKLYFFESVINGHMNKKLFKAMNQSETSIFIYQDGVAWLVLLFGNGFPFGVGFSSFGKLNPESKDW